MKLMKAVKKLNFWSKKKRKKKDYYHNYQKLPNYDFQPCHNPPPPPPRPPPPWPQENCQCHFCHPAEPSAPPLPPWLEPQQEGAYSNFTFADTISEQELDDQYISISHERAAITAANKNNNTTTSTTSSSQSQEIVVRDADASADNSGSCGGSNSALQQYSPSREKDAAANAAAGASMFGCVVDVGGLLFRCFFPCFHISEPRSYRVSHDAFDYHSIEKKRI